MSLFNIIKSIVVFSWRIWVGFLAFLGIATLGIFILMPLILISEKLYPLAYKIMRLWAKIVFYGAGFTYKYVGDLYLDKKKSYMIIANHTSMIDALVMLIIVKQPMVFIGKAEAAKIPLFGILYKRLCILVDRDSRESRQAVFEQTRLKIKEGYSICIFPEGGVPDDERIDLGDFKMGAFVMAIEHQLDIAVFSLWGLKKMFPFSYFRGYPGKVWARLNEIVDVKEYNIENKTFLKQHAYDLLHKQIQAYKASSR